ncbi:MAG: hypothetical protein QOJ84_4300 [Bradyrhizobium sp.]|jgi:hypothetical protein|nr:hypothetical protein [Bradyrhizobium sp.]
MRAFHPAKPTVPFSTLIAAALLVAVSSSPADAQIKTSVQYAVKTLCTLFGDIGFGDAMAPGRYRTLINIHNPTEKKIEVARKFALAGKPGDPLGSFSVTPYKAFTLGPDQAVAYNCFDVANFFCPINGICVDFTAIDGFLVINSAEELDVVAVYSGNPKGGEVSTLDTETVAARKIAKVIKIEADKPKLQPEKRIPAEPFVTIKP